MAQNYSIDSMSSCRDSVDSCMNEAILMTSLDTCSNEPIDNAYGISCSAPREQSIVAAGMNDAANFSPEISAKPRHEIARSREERVRTDSRSMANTVMRFAPELMASDGTNVAQLLSHGGDKSDGEFCESLAEFTSSSIEGSNIWPALTTLRRSLGDASNEDIEAKGKDEIMEDLQEMFDHDPHNFTLHLLTIIEETSDLSISGMPTMDSYCPPCESASHDSTRYMSFKRYGLRNTSNDGEIRRKDSPLSAASGETRRAIDYRDARDDSCTGCSRPKGSECDEIPMIVIVPGTPKTRHDSSESQPVCNDDENYVTADSEVEDFEESTTILNTDKSKNDTMNLSKVIHRHKEWAEAFNHFCNTEGFDKPLASSAPVNREERIRGHANKLEKRRLYELFKKRVRCFDMLNNLLRKTSEASAATSANVIEGSVGSDDLADESGNLCTRCKRQMEFYNTLTACSDYYTYACDEKDYRNASKTRPAKKKRRSLSRSPDGPSRANTWDSRENSTKKVSRKSLGKKGKSPSMRHKSPRCSVIVKPSMRISPEIRRNNVKSTFHDVDVSSIRPVSQLRAIFSPKNNPSGLLESEIPARRRVTSRTYTANAAVASKVSSAQRSPTDNRAGNFTSTANRTQFKHVKSPVAEYIRGKKT